MDLTVTVKQGKLKGSLGESVKGDPFVKFLGIPYAKPPVGDLRFKAPQPADSWTGERDATKEGNPNIQYDLFTDEKIGAEDSLYLNVFTKNVRKSTSDLKPVMVWIHGGGFMSGSNSVTLYGPEVLMTKDIVLVSINYRLGIFGFLSVKDPSLDVPGNAGMKDMVLALKWVQENIESFSGDPKNVTIFGESAGGAAVHLLVLSSAANGLFHRAIAMSGSALNHWALGDTDVIKVAKALGKEVKTEMEALKLLLELPAEDLREISRFPRDRACLANSMPFCPSIEHPNPTAFLTKHPRDIISGGEYNQVPFMVGWTNKEAIIMDYLFKSESELDIETLVPFDLGYQKGSEGSKAVAAEISDFYIKNDKTDLYDLATDTGFTRGIVESIEKQVMSSKQPIYFYQITAETKLAIIKNLFKHDKKGVSHFDELGFLFKTHLYDRICEPGSLEETATERMLTLFTNFAKYGNPTPTRHELSVEWKPVKDSGNLIYLDIGEELSLKVSPIPERIAFWKNLALNTKV